MQRLLPDDYYHSNKVNYFEQCHRFWGKFEEIPVIRVRKNILNPKKPSSRDISIPMSTPSPQRILYSPQKIKRRQTSVSIKRQEMYHQQLSQRKPSKNSIVSVPSISFDYS